MNLNILFNNNLMVIGTHSIFGFFDVNGLATDASALDNDIPEFAFIKLIKFTIKISPLLEHEFIITGITAVEWPVFLFKGPVLIF
jgi:hypothetical protein